MPNSPSEPWQYLEERFRVKREELAHLEIIEKSGDYWLTTGSNDRDKEQIKFEVEGVRALRKTGRGLKPTTYTLQLLEEQIEKNLVDINREELEKLLKREEMIPRELEKDGYVALHFEGSIIGCGMYKEDVVSSRIPKGRSQELIKILDQNSV